MKRGDNESMEMYVNRFDACVAKYVHQKDIRSAQDYQQWALLLIQNAKMTPDSRNSLTFQLTSGAAIHNHIKTSVTMTGDIELAKKAVKAISKAADTGADADAAGAIEEVQQIIKDIELAIKKAEQQTVPAISFADAIVAIKQIKVTPKPISVSTMLAGQTGRASVDGPTRSIRKNSIKDLKARTRCRACGKMGHWFRDNTDCLMKTEGLRIKDDEPP